MPNRRLPGFEQQLTEDLKATAGNFKDFLFTHGFKNGKVVDPLINLRSMQNNEIWGKDPVHPKEAAYDKIVEGVLRVASTLEEAGKKRRRTDSLDGGASSSSRRTDGRGGHYDGHQRASLTSQQWRRGQGANNYPQTGGYRKRN
jgi:hypothetical protein